MNLLADVSYTTVNNSDDFNIRVERISSGWMVFDIGTVQNRVSYSASYLTEALADLLNSAIFLLDYQKNNTIKTYRGNLSLLSRSYLFVCHELEPGHIIWHFQPKQNQLKILVWQNLDWSLVENIGQYGYNNGYYELEPEILPDLQQHLLFALQMPSDVFGKILLNTVRDIEDSYTPESYYEKWHSEYPVNLITELRGRCNLPA